MKTLFKRIYSEDAGVLTFEWILLITLLAIGIVGGLSAARDAVISELGDVAGAVTAVDQSYTVETDPCLEIGNEFGFQDQQESVQICRSESLLSLGESSDPQGDGPGEEGL